MCAHLPLDDFLISVSMCLPSLGSFLLQLVLPSLWSYSLARWLSICVCVCARPLASPTFWLTDAHVSECSCFPYLVASPNRRVSSLPVYVLHARLFDCAYVFTFTIFHQASILGCRERARSRPRHERMMVTTAWRGRAFATAEVRTCSSSADLRETEPRGAGGQGLKCRS